VHLQLGDVLDEVLEHGDAVRGEIHLSRVNHQDYWHHD
jgi:hypothetical protein